jgi:F-type H+-transporting ATPase subunit delta
MTSRAQVAHYVASKLPDDRQEAIRKAAAWLVDQKRGNEVQYLANDVARALEADGYSYVRVTTAHHLAGPASDDVRQFVSHQTGAKHVEVENVTDESIVGGVRIETPDRELDATVAHKLAKFVEGVSL